MPYTKNKKQTVSVSGECFKHTLSRITTFVIIHVSIYTERKSSSLSASGVEISYLCADFITGDSITKITSNRDMPFKIQGIFVIESPIKFKQK